MKISRHELGILLREAMLYEADTSAFEGDHDPIRIEIPALEKFATEQNFDGEMVWFGDSDAFSLAEILEEDEPSIEDFGYDENKWQKAVNKWSKVHDYLDTWEFEDKEELAANIRAVIQSTEDSGYEY